MKKIISSVVIAAMLYLLIPVPLAFAASTFAGGTGSSSNPYLIATATQLDAVRNYLSSCFKLTTDIDVSTLRSKNWLPIGNYTTPFKGTLDGGGHKIKNLIINRTDTEFVGLFGHTSYATLKNITLDQVSITGKRYMGSLAGTAEHSTIDHCTASGVVSATTTSIGWPMAGGLLGMASESTLAHDVSSCTVSLTKAPSTNPVDCIAGGLCGYVYSSKISDCQSDGNITGFLNVGGFIGQATQVTITNSSSSGNVSCLPDSNLDGYAPQIGGFLGRMFGSTIDYCQTNTTVSFTAPSSGGQAGGFVGWAHDGTIKNCTASGNVSDGDYVGGFVGSACLADSAEVLTISDCKSAGNVSGSNVLGGFIGSTSYITNISRSISTGEVNGSGTGNTSGGFLGSDEANYKYYNRFVDCYTLSVVSSTSKNAGGFAGVSSYSYLTRCSWCSANFPVGIGKSSGADVMDIGAVANGYIPTGETLQLQPVFSLKPVVLTAVSSDNESVVTVNSDGTITGIGEGTSNITYTVQFDTYTYTCTQQVKVGIGFDGGTGTDSDPYLISTSDQLINMADYLYSYYQLENDIDLLNDGSWAPIGNSSHPFCGGFDGAGHKISGMTIDQTVSCAGLFGYGYNARIKNINMEDAYINVGSYSGALVGYMNGGIVQNCSATGQITATTSTVVYSGMLVGYMSSGVLSDCYAIGDVTSYYAGVFAGYMGGTMTNCYWYSPETKLGIAKGGTSNCTKIDMNISGLLVGQEVQSAIPASGLTSAPPQTFSVSTNFKLSSSPTAIEFLASSDPTVLSISDGKLKALKVGQSVITTKLTYSNGKVATVDYLAMVTPPYTVTFNSQGGSAVNSRIAAKNSLLTAPAAPYKSGYRFAGWYKQAACTTPWSFSTDKVPGNMTLYARWAIPTPVIKAYSASYNSVKIAWPAISGGAKGYEIYRAASATGTYTKIATTSSLQYINTSLSTGRTYYYKVRAYRLSGSTKVYGDYSAVVSVKPLPAAPTCRAARVSSTSIKAYWSAVGGATKYELWRSTSKTGTYKLVAVVTARSFINTGLSTGTTYYYKVRAYRLVGTTKVYGYYSAIAYARP